MAARLLLHAAHAPRADRFDAGLLDRFEHRARLLAAGHELSMHRRIVTGEPQRNRVGMAAHDRGLALVEPARAAPAAAPCWPASPGRSAANATSMSLLPAMARRQTPTARLNGSVGASLAGFLGLMLELMTSTVIPARKPLFPDAVQRH